MKAQKVLFGTAMVLLCPINSYISWSYLSEGSSVCRAAGNLQPYDCKLTKATIMNCYEDLKLLG